MFDCSICSIARLLIKHVSVRRVSAHNAQCTTRASRCLTIHDDMVAERKETANKWAVSDGLQCATRKGIKIVTGGQLGSRNVMIGFDDQAFMGDCEVLSNWYDADLGETCVAVIYFVFVAASIYFLMMGREIPESMVYLVSPNQS